MPRHKAMLYNDASDSASVWATPTTIATYTIAPWTIGTDGEMIIMNVSWTFWANANAKRFVVNLWASQIFDSTSQIQNGGTFTLVIGIVKSWTNCRCFIDANYSSGVTLFTKRSEYIQVAQNLSTSKVLSIVATWVSNWDITKRIMNVHL